MPGVVFAEDESVASLLEAFNPSKKYKGLVKKRAAKRPSVTKCLNKIATEPCETEFEIKFSKLICLTRVTVFNAEVLSTKCARQSYLWSAGSLDTLPWLRLSRPWSLGQCQCFFFLNCYTCLRSKHNLYLTP